MAEKKQVSKHKGEITHSKMEQTLGKAILDEDFRKKLFSDPDGIGRKLGLNKEGIELIKNMDQQAFTKFKAMLREDLMKSAAVIIFCASY